MNPFIFGSEMKHLLNLVLSEYGLLLFAAPEYPDLSTHSPPTYVEEIDNSQNWKVMSFVGTHFLYFPGSGIAIRKNCFKASAEIYKLSHDKFYSATLAYISYSGEKENQNWYLSEDVRGGLITYRGKRDDCFVDIFLRGGYEGKSFFDISPSRMGFIRGIRVFIPTAQTRFGIIF